MRVARFENELEAVLNNKVFVTVDDIAAACPGAPMPTVYSRINKYLKEGKLSVAGRGRYVTAPKPAYVPGITPWMQKVNEYLFHACVGVDHCLAEKDGNLFVQVCKPDLQKVTSAMQRKYSKVIRKEDYMRFPLKLDGYIVIDRLISESPLIEKNGVSVPSLEKMLVDSVCDGNDKVDRLTFQKTLESNPVNVDSMLRYASRRGVRNEMKVLVDGLDWGRLEMMAKVQKCLASIPVEKAWLFGSFARGEETPSSDLDLLVDYMAGTNLSLLDVVRFKKKLESITGRDVDLVENGYLKPFAVSSVERDKYLIYAR